MDLNLIRTKLRKRWQSIATSIHKSYARPLEGRGSAAPYLVEGYPNLSLKMKSRISGLVAQFLGLERDFGIEHPKLWSLSQLIKNGHHEKVPDAFDDICNQSKGGKLN